MAGTVVCGIDGSEESQQAAQEAAWLARALGAHPVLVHAVTKPPAFSRVWREKIHGRCVDAADVVLVQTRLDRFAEVDRRIVRGEAADALAAVALETHAHLVAVGSRGRGPVRAALLGSTSVATIRRCSCPVLVVPRRVVGRALSRRSIVCGIDGSRDSIHALRAAVSLHERLGLDVVLVHVQVPETPTALRSRGIHPPPDYNDRLEQGRQAAAHMISQVRGAAGLPRSTRERVEQGGVVDRLDAAATAEEAALIIVGARGIGGLEAAVVGSVSSKLARMASRPVLVVKRDTAAGLTNPG